MNLTKKEKEIVESALYDYKEECYVLWHAGEIETAEWQESSLAIESVRKKIWKTDYEVWQYG